MVRMGNIHNIILHLPIYQTLCIIFLHQETQPRMKSIISRKLSVFPFNCTDGARADEGSA